MTTSYLLPLPSGSSGSPDRMADCISRCTSSSTSHGDYGYSVYGGLVGPCTSAAEYSSMETSHCVNEGFEFSIGSHPATNGVYTRHHQAAASAATDRRIAASTDHLNSYSPSSFAIRQLLGLAASGGQYPSSMVDRLRISAAAAATSLSEQTPTSLVQNGCSWMTQRADRQRQHQQPAAISRVGDVIMTQPGACSYDVTDLAWTARSNPYNRTSDTITSNPLYCDGIQVPRTTTSSSPFDGCSNFFCHSNQQQQQQQTGDCTYASDRLRYVGRLMSPNRLDDDVTSATSAYGEFRRRVGGAHRGSMSLFGWCNVTLVSMCN